MSGKTCAVAFRCPIFSELLVPWMSARLSGTLRVSRAVSRTCNGTEVQIGKSMGAEMDIHWGGGGCQVLKSNPSIPDGGGGGDSNSPPLRGQKGSVL